MLPAGVVRVVSQCAVVALLGLVSEAVYVSLLGKHGMKKNAFV